MVFSRAKPYPQQDANIDITPAQPAGHDSSLFHDLVLTRTTCHIELRKATLYAWQ